MTDSVATAPLPDPTLRLPIEPFESVIARVLAVARERPDAAAVVAGDVSWSYARLTTAALGLAHELANLDVEPGQAVAVTGAKSPGLLTVILAVLARNAILVPLDPALPALRRREMLERADARILVEAGDPSRVGPIDLIGTEIRRFSMPDQPEVTDEVQRLADAYELPPIDGDDPAYLLFTSGTTGEPKGIVGRQRGLSHFLGWERRATGIGAGDRIAQLTGLSFDVVLRDLFLPLTAGAALHLPPFAPGATPPADLLEFLERDRITLIHAVPTITNFWLSDVPDEVRLPDLRWVLFAGEPLPGALVRRWRERFGTKRIGNLYGPTETTLAKCFAEIGPEPEPGVQPVGHAIDGAQALVMKRDRLCEPGEMGEIVIRTPYRSLGYLGASGDPRPPFIRNPFTDDPTDLVYRTGDRGRYRPDGVLEIHGRLDDQVKILGVRIEPSEVAAELAALPEVRTATVVAWQDPHGDNALVAYVVPEDAELDEVMLREALAERLIAAKVPRVFVSLPELPRTPNGKVDRRALPEPDWSGHRGSHADMDAADGGGAGPVAAGASSSNGTPPSSNGTGGDATRAITEIFRELLANPGLGPDDDFFRVGGHSLLAARLIQRIEARLGVRIQVRSLFLHPTARSLAALVESGGEGARPASGATGAAARSGARTPGSPSPRATRGHAQPGASTSTASSARRAVPAPATGAAADALVPIEPRGTLPPLFVIPGVGSRILFLRHLARNLGPDQPLYALHTRFLDDGSVYEDVRDLASVYVRALQSVQPSGPYRLLGFSFGGLLALEMAQQLRAAGREVAFLGVVDTRLPSLRLHGSWSVARSIPRRLLNLAALLQPLSGPARREYLRTRLLIARQSGVAHVVHWFRHRFPRGLLGWAPAHPYGPEEVEWLDADRAASRRYDPKAYPGRITYFWAAHDQHPPSVYDHREGWAEIALGGLDVRPVPGNHLTVLAEPLVRTSARVIRDALDERAWTAVGPAMANRSPSAERPAPARDDDTPP